MLDRSKAPIIHPIDKIDLPEPRVVRLDNGIPVYVTDMVAQDAVRLEMVFDAGRTAERKPLAARTTAALLKEGTSRYSSAVIAEMLDFYGASLSFPFQPDSSNLVLFSLGRHLPHLLPLMEDLLEDPVFPEEELRQFIQRNQKILLEELTKVDAVAYRQITEAFFGESHPYGYNSSVAMYGELTRNDLVDHFERCYTADSCSIFISGSVDGQYLDLLNRTLGRLSRRGDPGAIIPPPPAAVPKKYKYVVPGTLQTAIRVGSPLFNRRHPDYPGFYVLNTILGGYFGSRLMQNIREDKGYTYNIYSTSEHMLHGGCFYIATEVGHGYAAATLKEIYLEMARLCEEPVEEEELTMVRNYLIGQLLTTVDGPFNISEVVRGLVQEGLPADFQNRMAAVIRTITPAEITKLAQKYLARENQWEVVVSNSN